MKIPKAGRAGRKGAAGWAALQLVERAVTPVETRTRKSVVVIASATGAVALYFLDPQQGNRRRSMARDRALALLRRGKVEAVQRGDYAAGHVKGAAHEVRDRATPDQPKPGLTDQELARKVESIVFRDAEVPKGQINVDAAGSTVWLRGEVPTEEMRDELASQASGIPEVQKVENLLHLPGAPAPTRADAPADARRDTSFLDAPRAPEPSGEVTAEQKGRRASETTPAESAASGTGRQAAPLGSEEGEADTEEK